MSTASLLFPEDTYTRCSPFGPEEGVRVLNTRLVTARKPHWCAMSGLYLAGQHHVQAGETALRSKAVVDGKLAASYSCIPCMDRFLTEDAGLDPEEERSSA